MLASTARTVGSVNADIRSAARARGEEFSWRVVGYSTGSKPNSRRSRTIATACTAGNIPGAANDGDITATRSPVVSLLGTVKSGRMPAFKTITRADDSPGSTAGKDRKPQERAARPAADILGERSRPLCSMIGRA